jgi:hypothetical protein
LEQVITVSAGGAVKVGLTKNASYTIDTQSLACYIIEDMVIGYGRPVDNTTFGNKVVWGLFVRIVA